MLLVGIGEQIIEGKFFGFDFIQDGFAIALEDVIQTLNASAPIQVRLLGLVAHHFTDPKVRVRG
jgi:hypothetical protein